ncbi:U-box domain-containing protein 40-like [Dioscorea cayenensis subsp. rotundata]|uniref:RING-type E3 ubiquitin transferase n=1 Tax=Dioscorea cayennensis subsp. rotundata TaxID=55577 RepID=A0AB40AYJ0_DIOCR|nr:U-box domain-containing protein 40-like [Dioscorea cayenensis subsp. rotundata]
MGSGKHRWRLSFHRSRSPSPSPEPPPEFLCPLSSTLMADPVIVPSGHTFERAVIQACNDLHFVPPIISSQSSPLLLIPNSALASAISRWCELSGHPHPVPLPLDSALALVRRLMAVDDGGPKSCSTSSEDATPTPTPTATASAFSVSSSSSSEIVDETLDDPLEIEILNKIKDPRVSEQESGLISLRRATREGQERRISLCTRRLLAALRPMLVSRYESIQGNAVAALVNLSLEAKNKVPVVRSGAVPALVDVLRCGHDEARDHAAGAIFSLAMEDENKAAIGVLGAVPPLIHLLCRSVEKDLARRDAGMAIYHLCLASSNRARVMKTPGAVRGLLGVAKEGGEIGKVAMRVIGVIAGAGEGRTAMMDAGAVSVMVEMMKKGIDEEGCVVAMYGMSRGSGWRFRGLAREVGAEEVVERVVEKEGRTEMVKEMGRRVVKTMRGEMEMEMEMEMGRSVRSENGEWLGRKMMMGRRDLGGGAGAGGELEAVNSAEF